MEKSSHISKIRNNLLRQIATTGNPRMTRIRNLPVVPLSFQPIRAFRNPVGRLEPDEPSCSIGKADLICITIGPCGREPHLELSIA